MTQVHVQQVRLVAPGDIQGEITSRRERRYLVDQDTAANVAKALKGHEDKQHPSYMVHTTYLSSKGAPYRLRQYDGDSPLQLESKTRDITGRTLKARFKLTEQPPKARYQGSVSYSRRAFNLNGSRVTIDSNVQTTGKSLQSVVVEVKGPTIPTQLNDLLPDESLAFGKRTWALGP